MYLSVDLNLNFFKCMVQYSNDKNRKIMVYKKTIDSVLKTMK